MQSKFLSFLFPIAILFVAGCGNSTSDQSAKSTASPKDSLPGNCSSSAQGSPAIVFGDPGSNPPDTSAGWKAGCPNQGICNVNLTSTVNPITVNVNVVYTQSTNATPSTLVMTFPFQKLLKNQPSDAPFFYNNRPIATYQFVNNFTISNLGAPFAGVCGTINATPAGAGVITYNPPVDTSNPPPNAQMTSQVVVTFTVTP